MIAGHKQRPFKAERVIKRASVVKPDMGRATSRAGGGMIDVGTVGGRRRTVRHDHRRAVIARAKRKAGNVEFLARMAIKICASLGAGGNPLIGLVLDAGRRAQLSQ